MHPGTTYEELSVVYSQLTDMCWAGKTILTAVRNSYSCKDSGIWRRKVATIKGDFL